MKRICRCGKSHDFTLFKRFKTTFGGVTSHYQFFCEELNRLMILTTTIMPTSLASVLCPHRSLKKYSKVETLQESAEFVDTLYCLAKKD